MENDSPIFVDMSREHVLASQKKELKSLGTRKLLKYRDKALACGGGYDPTESGRHAIPIDLIYEELNTREHIPNKIEAKKIRQDRAKHGKSQSHKRMIW
jgi:hypothetical protein